MKVLVRNRVALAGAVICGLISIFNVANIANGNNAAWFALAVSGLFTATNTARALEVKRAP